MTRGEAALRKFLSLLGVSDPSSRPNAHFRLGMIREKQGDVANARSAVRFGDRAQSAVRRSDPARA
jgi:hypothetical protein